jgi:dihydroxyacid dehydratase/phosphogluconate dehydratase
MVHTGRAVVFEDIEDFHARIDDETWTSTRTASWC